MGLKPSSTSRDVSLSRRSIAKLALALGASAASTVFVSGTAVAQGRNRMMLATTTVADYDRWMEVFAGASLAKRKQHGSAGATVFRDPNDETRVWVLFDWDEEGWQQFVSDPEVPPILQRAGHTSKAKPARLTVHLEA